MVNVLQDAGLLADQIKGALTYVVVGTVEKLIVSPYLAAQLLDGLIKSAGSSSPLQRIAELLAVLNQPLDKAITAIGHWSDELASYILQHAGDIYQVAIGVPLLKTALVPSQWGKTEYYLLFEVEAHWGIFILARNCIACSTIYEHHSSPDVYCLQCPGSPGKL